MSIDEPVPQPTTASHRPPRLVAPTIYWPRIFAEGAAIVISILLAFALDAWWDGVRADRDESVTLDGLRADFAANAAALDRLREAALGMQAIADSILTLTGPTTTVNEEHATRLLANMLKTLPPFDPVEGTLGALLASQGLSAISDPALRVQLAGWLQTTGPIQRRSEGIGAFMDDRFMPYLFSRVPVRTLDALGAPELGARQSRFQLAPDALFRQMDFENLVNEFYFDHSSLLAAIATARAATDSIIDLIDQDPRSAP